MIALVLTSCQDQDNGSIDAPLYPIWVSLDVAARSNGAIATADFNSTTAANINDENSTTSWISDPDSPLVIDFGSVENINKITILKVDAPVSLGSSPDLLIEFSENGVDYLSVSFFTNYDVVFNCGGSRMSSTVIECQLYDYPANPARYLRITSKNGLSYEFEEVQVIARKEFMQWQ